MAKKLAIDIVMVVRHMPSAFFGLISAKAYTYCYKIE
jgi:hypothetical protein